MNVEREPGMAKSEYSVVLSCSAKLSDDCLGTFIVKNASPLPSSGAVYGVCPNCQALIDSGDAGNSGRT